MRIFISLVIVGAIFLGFLAIALIRTASHDPDLWHVDPRTVAAPDTPNWHLVADPEIATATPHSPAPVYAASPVVLAEAFDNFVLRQRDTQRIAGRPVDQWMTYVQRTEAVKFPDYISVVFYELEEGRSTLAIFSRSRYGYGDLGVNGERVEGWLGTLQSFEE
ncbi:MAG: DUF1499 domain-containing protein [Pseudomonadota bacterium]